LFYNSVVLLSTSYS